MPAPGLEPGWVAPHNPKPVVGGRLGPPISANTACVHSSAQLQNASKNPEGTSEAVWTEIYRDEGSILSSSGERITCVVAKRCHVGTCGAGVLDRGPPSESRLDPVASPDAQWGSPPRRRSVRLLSAQLDDR